jgi:hypothetical protein
MYLQLGVNFAGEKNGFMFDALVSPELQIFNPNNATQEWFGMGGPDAGFQASATIYYVSGSDNFICR